MKKQNFDCLLQSSWGHDQGQGHCEGQSHGQSRVNDRKEQRNNGEL